MDFVKKFAEEQFEKQSELSRLDTALNHPTSLIVLLYPGVMDRD